MPPQGDTSICGKYTVLIWLLLILNKDRRKYAALDLYITAVKPGNYGLAFTMGKWFLTDNSATVGRILMISSADPHEIFDRYSQPWLGCPQPKKSS